MTDAIVVIPHSTRADTIRTALKHYVPYYTCCMFIVYMSVYYTICTDPKDARNDTLAFDTKYGRKAYTWYTYSLLHSGNVHLATNMFTLFTYGTIMELEHGPLRSFSIHTLCIIGAAFAVGWESRFKDERIIVIGASGGIYGLLSSQISNLALNWTELEIIKRILYTLFVVSSVVADIVINIVMYNPDISYAAHVGGFVTGVFAAFCLMKNIKVIKWENIAWHVSTTLLTMLMTAGMINTLLLNRS